MRHPEPFYRFLRHSAQTVLGLVLAIMVLMGSLHPAQAQDAAAKDPNNQALEQLVETLEDDAKRAEFLDTLKTALAAQQEVKQEPSLGAEFMGTISQNLGRAGDQFESLVGQLGTLPASIAALQQNLDTAEEQQAFGMGLLKVIAALAVGTIARLIARALIRPLRGRLMTSIKVATSWEQWPLRVLLAFLVLFPAVVMVGAAWLLLPFFHASGMVLDAIMGFVLAVALLRAVAWLSEIVFYPTDSFIRSVPMSDEGAAYLHRWICRVSAVAILGYFAITIAGVLGLAAASAAMLMKILGLVIALMTISFILKNRRCVAAALVKGTDTPPEGHTRRTISQILRQRLADIWHVLAAVYVGAAFVVWVSDVKGGFLFMAQSTALSALVIVIAILGLQALHWVVGRAFTLPEQQRERYPGLEKRIGRYGALSETIGRSVVGILAVLSLCEAWSIDAFAWFSNPIGQRVLSGAITIAVVLILALILWEVASAWIERYFSSTDDEGNVVSRSARAHTLLPLARNILIIVLGVVVVLTILSEIGVNIAPLLAGAGVIGLAVGFGSQKLVQDVITGAFILIENAVSVGDVVEAGGHAGLVEGMTIRSLRLRDASGCVHTIPFSSVDTVVNMTKDFSFYMMNIGVAYREDIDHVYKVLREVAEDLAADPEFGPDILDALEIQGVDQFADSAVIIRARIKTKPIQQWRVGREFNKRMKKAFDNEGIEIPFPHQTIYFGEDRDGKAPPMHLRMERRPTRDISADVTVEEAPEMGPPAPSSATRDLPV